MGILLDVLLCAVVVISLVIGAKAGVVRSLVGFAGSLFALIASAVLSGFLADVVCSLSGREATAVEYNMIRVIASLVLYVGLQVLVFLAGRALDMVFRLPGLHMVNAVCGAVCGALRGAVIAVLICAVLSFSMPSWQPANSQAPEETLSQSRLYVLLYEENPVAQLFRQA